jgi:hypothetical protein
VGGVFLAFLGEHIQTDFGSRKILAEAIVKFARDAATLLILHSKQFHR